jgi:hypothetical protein
MEKKRVNKRRLEERRREEEFIEHLISSRSFCLSQLPHILQARVSQNFPPKSLRPPRSEVKISLGRVTKTP